MTRHQGIHFYINIDNFNEVLLAELGKTKNVNHSIHALDTFFSSIETYGKKKYPETFAVEKVTGARLHLYVTDGIVSGYQTVEAVSAYAYRICDVINKDISKYDSLKSFRISIGAAYGKFYDFEFTMQNGYSETTTIGHAANYAAKLQAKAGSWYLNISEDIFEALPLNEKRLYAKVTDPSILKYGQDCYYTAPLSMILYGVVITPEDLDILRDRAYKVNLTDIEFSSARKLLDFNNLSIKQCKELTGVPVFADIRGFTSQFAEDDSNLPEMAQKTRAILEKMYRATTEHNGIHVQFQGDREFALYHNVTGGMVDDEYVHASPCWKAAVLGAMRMIDAVKPYSVHIGVGEDFGTLYATRIGARGEKDNILLGETVIYADYLEDKKAAEDQLVISAEVYNNLKAEDSVLASKFKRTADGDYIATIGFEEYTRNLMFNEQKKNTNAGNYNKAWGGSCSIG